MLVRRAVLQATLPPNRDRHTILPGGVQALDGFSPIKDIPNGVYLTGFFCNYPTQKLFDALFAFKQRHALRPPIGSRFAFDDLPAALAQQDNE